MTPENKKFLSRRLRDAVSKQPELKQLKTLLLQLGGDSIVAPPRTPDQDVSSLLKSGFVTSGPITLKVMKSSSCHQNIAAVWTKKRFGIVGIATGYALSEDGLWRQHSWGILREGVLETTEAREKYFGIVLQGEKADFFAFSNSS